MFVLWLRNQRYYIHDVIGIKMMYRDLPYYEGISAKTCREYKLKHKNHANSIHTFRKWSITWSQFVLSGCSKHWPILHSMVSTAIYSSRDCNAIKHEPGFRKCEENQSPFFVASLLFNVVLALVAWWINFCLMSAVSKSLLGIQVHFVLTHIHQLKKSRQI